MLPSIQIRLFSTCTARKQSYTMLKRAQFVTQHQPLLPTIRMSYIRSCFYRKSIFPPQWRSQYQKTFAFYNTSSNNNKQLESSTAKLKQKTENAKVVINKLKDAIPTHENIYTIPNFLTFSRLLSAPFIGYLIVQHNYDIALGVFALAGFTDMLDGYIARRYNLKTVVGSIIDPAADKTLMTVMTITLAMEGVLPLPLAGVILGRDIGLIIAAFYYRYISLPAPKTFTRYWDFSIPSAEVRPTTISKVNTALQLLLMGSSLTSMSMGIPSAEMMTAMHWLVGTTTVWSGASYVFSKDAVRILNQSKP
ncbi:phosphatidyl synthase [Halteromyces radiatus]|uniref:phosphatidyl synthase n=1 Tax=Halteromyces radiatus TaxID=101107 RepID=UPI00221E67B3|nr:phosphatidyl synthase [Halteromyces radiatus]KAI8084745.1 phosphatidyl synthase [Halteromyces radiatus]